MTRMMSLPAWPNSGLSMPSTHIWNSELQGREDTRRRKDGGSQCSLNTFHVPNIVLTPRDTAMDRDVLSIVLELAAQQRRQMLNKLKFNGI